MAGGWSRGLAGRTGDAGGIDGGKEASAGAVLWADAAERDGVRAVAEAVGGSRQLPR